MLRGTAPPRGLSRNGRRCSRPQGGQSGVEVGAEVLQSAVAHKEGDRGPRLRAGEQCEGCGEVGPRREAGEDPLLSGERARAIHRLLVRDREEARDEGAVEEGKPRHGVAAALHAVARARRGVPCEDGRPGGLEEVGAELRVLPAEEAGDAGEAAARAGEIHEGVDRPARLLPHLGSGVAFVGEGIALALELVGTESATLAGDLAGSLLDEGEVGAGDLVGRRARRLGHEDHLGAEGAHHAGAFDGVSLRHHGDERVAEGPADDGEAGSRVPTGEFDHGLALAEFASGTPLVDHLKGDAVLLAEPGVEILELGKQAPADLV